MKRLIVSVMVLTIGASLCSATAWSPDGTRLSYIGPEGNLLAVEAATGLIRVLATRGQMESLIHPAASELDRAHRERYHQPSYFWAPDSRHLLFDSAGQLWLFDPRTGAKSLLASPGEGSGDDPKFSPDGRYLSYVRDHNLYLQSLQEESGAPSGSAGPAVAASMPSANPALLNGEVDWVYEEELDVRSNYFWSPDSKRVAYLETNESRVSQYPIENLLARHPTVDWQRYPGPGEPNPLVRLGVVNAEGGNTTWIRLPPGEENEYVPRFGWVNRSTLWIETLSRDQRKITLFFADLANGQVKPVLVERDDRFLDESYDVDVTSHDLLLTSWRDGHRHIYLYRFDPENPLGGAILVRQLTAGDWDVAEIEAVDARTVYYLSNEGDPRQQQLWSVQMDGKTRRRLSTSEGWHDADFSPGAKLFADTRSSLTSPPSFELCTLQASCKTLWKAAAPPAQFRPPLQLELKASDGTTVLYGSLTLPPQATAANRVPLKKSVPLILNPYGGPDEQEVVDRWSSRNDSFDQVLAQHGFAVLVVDNRGMAGRGKSFAQAAYRNFGPVQFGDQVAALDQVLRMYPQLDPQKLGWWGWSWGGTFALYAMTHSDRFRAGVAVAPVTDWRNYDSIYTERYMGEPAANAEEYAADSVIESAGDLKGRLLLAQGTDDDNVHLSNTIQFIDKLVDRKIPYDLQLYPGNSHGIEDPEARAHLFARILDHFERYLVNPAAAAPETAKTPQ